ncbi:MAG TPA: NAD(P)-dependent glycerol-3-phosphate dehydrogenase [Kiritimatiellae bacterium]|nr:NAD(P)-dependent glycerol-3-phosphate dehydrogenase [Kiritimatiellia bacterium]
MEEIAAFGIIGDGGWGTALAVHLDRLGHRVTVWGPFPQQIEEIRGQRENVRFLPGVKLNRRIRWTAEPAEACRGVDFLVAAVPSRFLVKVLEKFPRPLPPEIIVVNVAKGFEPATGRRLSLVIREILQTERVAVLSGPSHAEEVARGVPTAVVAAAPDMSLARRVQDVFSGRGFRVYTTDDMVGVELGGALKNIMAIAAGISDGLGFGDNTKAALITRGLAEMIRLGRCLGARTETFAGLSGIGDLVVTATSRLSRNRAVGERIGKGEPAGRVVDSMAQVAEGVWACLEVRRLATRHGIQMPITEQVYQVIHGGKSPAAAVQNLLERPFRDEFY